MAEIGKPVRIVDIPDPEEVPDEVPQESPEREREPERVPA
jgi:hypothetical protein